MAKMRERETERKRGRQSRVLVHVSIYGLFIYAHLSGLLPSTPAEDSHRRRARDVPNRQKALCEQADICFSPPVVDAVTYL